MLRPLLALSLALTSMLPNFAAEPMLTKTDLFTANTDGYVIYRIPGIIVTPKGSLLAYCEARKSRSDWAAIDALVRRSTDGGSTWEPARKIVSLEGKFEKNPIAIARKSGTPGEITMNNIVMISEPSTGAIHCLYCIEYLRVFYTRSDDDGKTFSAPTEITATCDKFRAEYDWKVIATGPGHGIVLKSGRLLVPVWLSLGTEGIGHKPSLIATIFSDDHGKTWQAGSIVPTYFTVVTDPSETVAVELTDGRVMLNIRNTSPLRRRGIAFSPDGATKWSKPAHSDTLTDPVCMAGLCRVPSTNGEKILLFTNPSELNARKSLTVRLSTDDGVTWPVSKLLEPGASAYSDVAATADGSLYCFYERGRPDAKTPDAKSTDAYQLLTVAKFNRAWLTEKSSK